MGYETSLYLLVKIKRSSMESVSRALKTGKVAGYPDLEYFLQCAVMDRDGFLAFKEHGNYTSSYLPDEDDGTVPALDAKWYEAEKIAEWLKKHSRKGGSIIQHSREGDGAAWGWEFDGRGHMRELALCSIGRWK
jgi:hypothetical protein